MTEPRALRPPADQAQRDAALDLGRSFIVQAPAGSGKTELLTQRMLKLLGRVEKPERVLAITFTRRATQEMRDRILRRLRQAAGGVPVEEHERRAVEFGRAVLDNGARHGWSLLDNPARLRILTIDALCSALLQRSPEHGTALGGLAVLDDAGPLYRRAVRALFEDLQDPAAELRPGQGGNLHQSLVRVLSHLDGDAQKAEELLAGMLAIRDQWTAFLGAPTEMLQTVLRERQRAELETLRHVLGAAAWQRASDIVAALGAHVDDPSHPAAHCAVLPDPSADPETELWRAHWTCRVFLTDSGSMRGRTAIGKKLFRGVAAEFDEEIAELSALYQGWHDDPEALAAIGNIANKPPLDDAILDGTLLPDVLALLEVLLAELALVMAEEGQVDFPRIAEAALLALGGDGEAPGTVLLLEDQRLEHLLVDEFQDTSHTQHRLLRKLTEGWSPGDGRTLFLVGDPMQSIYRFRQADVGLFTRVVQQRRLGQVPVDPLELTANFRSRAEIVNFANEQFARIFPPANAPDSGAVAYRPAVAERGPGGAVQTHALLPDDPDQEEARRVAELVRASLDEDPDWQISVLVRARTHLASITRELLRQGIPFDAVRVDALSSRPVVQDLLAITRALAHPLDRIAWMALLRAPWCGLALADLHRVAGEDRYADLLQRMRDAAASGECLSEEQRARLWHLSAVLESAVAMAGSHSLAQRVEYAWLRLSGPRCQAGDEELENAAAFLALLAEIERDGPQEVIERLGDALERLHARGAPSRVKLMPIHQAKGLEFDVVILPGLHYGARGPDRPLLLTQQFTLDAAGNLDGVLMAPVKARWHEGPSLYDYLARVEKERQDYESRRVLYVAATRAKSRLHLLGRFQQNSAGDFSARANTFLAWLEPAFAAAISAAGELPPAVSQPEEMPSALPLLRLAELTDYGIVEPIRGDPATLRQPPGRNETALGEALHRLFELIHDHPDATAAIAWAEGIASDATVLDSLLRGTGADPAKLSELRTQLATLLKRTLVSATGRGLFDQSGKAASFSELPILARDGNRIVQSIVDLAWQDHNGDWHVVDFKTSSGSEAARVEWSRQLAGYSRLLQSVTGRAPESLDVFLPGQDTLERIE